MRRRSVFQSLGIRARVLLAALLPVGIAVALLGYNLASSRLDDAEQSLAERGSLIARNLALASEFALFSQNMPLVNEALRRIAAEPDVRWSAVWDAQRQFLVGSAEAPEQRRIDEIIAALATGRDLSSGYYRAPIHVERFALTDYPEEYDSNGPDGGTRGAAQLLGYALIETDRSRIDARRTAIMRNTMLITLTGLIAGLLFALLTSNSITRPILSLIHISEPTRLLRRSRMPSSA